LAIARSPTDDLKAGDYRQCLPSPAHFAAPNVGKIDSGALDPDQGLIWAGNGTGHLSNLKHLGSAELLNHDCAHDLGHGSSSKRRSVHET
jgi:hypothetical protein